MADEKELEKIVVKKDTKKDSVTGMTAEEMELEIKRLELEAKKLEVQEKKANLQYLRERLDERELRRENIRQRSITNGQTLQQLAAADRLSQSRCNHRKGGNGAEGVVTGQGDDSQYAVLKHTFCNGDTWVRCLRCGKTWKPPILSKFKTKEDYELALAEYQAAVGFQTRNVTSGSIMFK